MSAARSSFYIALLLSMLAGLMASHLWLLHTGLRQCDAYEKILLDRLRASEIGGVEAIAIRKELADYLSGKTTECGEAEDVYQEASDKYSATLLALLTGGGIAAGVAMQTGTRKPDPRSEPPDNRR